MTEAELRAIRLRNPQITYDDHTQNTRTDAELERNLSGSPLGKNQDESGTTTRVHIRFVSVRKRLIDPDNLAEKWLLDCLRNCRAIDGDEPEKITLETTQRKVTKGEAEHTRIDIYYGDQEPVSSYP
jgi:hypothetical protein